jgi:hypothetical protein
VLAEALAIERQPGVLGDDATLNPGGVRIDTAEIYRRVDGTGLRRPMTARLRRAGCVTARCARDPASVPSGSRARCAQLPARRRERRSPARPP